MSALPKTSLRLLEGALILVAVVLALRLFQIQVLQHEPYARLASRQWETELSLPPLRGNIFDRDGTPLALSGMAYRLSCDPEGIRNLDDEARDRLVADLAKVLDRPPKKLRRQLRTKGRYLVLHEHLTLSLDQRESLQRRGVLHLERRAERLYPLGALAASLIGLVNAAGQGVSGLEAGLDSLLAGSPGRALVQKDEHGRPIISPHNRVLVEPRPGGDVLLTLDRKVQAIAELELRRAVESSGAKAGCAVILDPVSGDILALASHPSPSERDRQRYRPAEWKLLPVQAIYEPGSTLKALTSIALLEKGGLDLDSQVDAEDGVARFPDGVVIRDDRPHYGWLTFREAFLVSSNICFAKFAENVADADLYACLRDLHFGNTYGIAVPGEEAGRLRKPSQWSRRSRRTLVFGHEISATPLQITAAVAALANDGRLMRPRIVQAQEDPITGRVEKRSSLSLRSVCRPETARLLRRLMGEVVQEGTGKAAAVSGLAVGGKTGTAQKFVDGKLARGKYLASFIGMAPLERPRVVVGVFIDDPDSAHTHGGQSAAPAFARIVERLAVSTDRLYDPGEAPRFSEVAGPIEAPRFLDLDPETAAALARDEDISYRFRGRGRRVVAQEPGPGCRLRPDATVLLVLGDPEQPAQTPPDLLGLSLRQARRVALERGYAVEAKGRGVVIGQKPPDPRRNGAIRLELALPKESNRS